MIAFLITALLSLFSEEPRFTTDRRSADRCRYTSLCVFQYQRPETLVCVDVDEVCR